MSISTELQPGGVALGIVGAGVMGRGIARLAAQAGTPVLLHDAREGAALQAVESLQQAWQGAVRTERRMSLRKNAFMPPFHRHLRGHVAKKAKK